MAQGPSSTVGLLQGLHSDAEYFTLEHRSGQFLAEEKGVPISNWYIRLFTEKSTEFLSLFRVLLFCRQRKESCFYTSEIQLTKLYHTDGKKYQPIPSLTSFLVLLIIYF